MSTSGLLRRHRALLVVVGLVTAGVVVLVLVGPRSPTPSDPLEPGNPNPGGAQALARVLADHGVQVIVAHGQSELAASAVDRDTTVFVTSTDQLSTHTSRRLRTISADAGALVLADAPPATVKALHLGLRSALTANPRPVRADCGDPLLHGLVLDAPPSFAHIAEGDLSPVEACFPVKVRRSSYGLVTRVDTRPSTYVVGADALFTNGQITHSDDAAIALRLLGRHPRLVWYVADAADVPAGDADPLSSLLPPWLGPAAVLVCLAVVATMFWRGRRLGPLVVEPLPVVVKAVESTAGRGRLYAKARDRDHVANLLRQATAVRLAEDLRLGRNTDVHQLVPVVASRSGRGEDDVRGLLTTGPVADDAALTLLAQRLTELEREVRQP